MKNCVEPLFDPLIKSAIIFYNTGVSRRNLVITAASVTSRSRYRSFPDRYRSTETFPEGRSAKGYEKEREKKEEESHRLPVGVRARGD